MNVNNIRRARHLLNVMGFRLFGRLVLASRLYSLAKGGGRTEDPFNEVNTVTVVGVQAGDEGKGRFVDLFAQSADFVVRFQGGENAGHTIVVGDKKIVLHLIPSGITHEGVVCVIGNGVVVNVESLVEEMTAVREAGYDVGPSNLWISSKAHITTRLHRVLDIVHDAALPHPVRTTGKGVGTTYAFKAQRRGIRMHHLSDFEALRRILERIVPEMNAAITKAVLAVLAKGDEWEWRPEVQRRLASVGVSLENPTIDLESLYQELLGFGRILEPYVRDTGTALQLAAQQGKKLLFEAQGGIVIDLDHGTYPDVTCSNTIAGAASAGSGVGVRTIGRGHVVGVIKAYLSSVGRRTLPTLLPIGDSDGDFLQQNGHEFGATTGLRRDTGWFDAVMVRWSMRANDVNRAVLTKVDVLTGMERIQVCIGYKGHVEMPESPDELASAVPVYRDLPGWSENITGCRSWDELPEACRRYIEFLEAQIGQRFWIISVGPERHQYLLRPRKHVHHSSTERSEAAAED